jgi:hypothetical protein
MEIKIARCISVIGGLSMFLSSPLNGVQGMMQQFLFVPLD